MKHANNGNNKEWLFLIINKSSAPCKAYMGQNTQYLEFETNWPNEVAEFVNASKYLVFTALVSITAIK